MRPHFMLMIAMNNPLLATQALPRFNELQAEQIEPAVDAVLAENRAAIEKLLQQDTFSWDSLIPPLEQIEERLSRVWSPIGHLHSVKDSPEWRAAYNACLPKLSEYHTELGQNQALYSAFEQVSQAADFADRDAAEQKLVTDALRNFQLSGVALPDEKKQQYREISLKLSELTTRFEEQVLDATQGWTLAIDELKALRGIPENGLALLKQYAEQREQSGWLITLEFPSFHAVMTYADDRQLREQLYTAFCTRASDQGPNAGQWDNSPVMTEILDLRLAMAQLLGFEHYAELSLATKMADSPAQVEGFLLDLAQRSQAQARAELEELQHYANEQGGPDSLAAWDLAYWSEKLRQTRYGLSQEDLRPYFPAKQTFAGLFDVVQRLYGIRIVETDSVQTWHEDVSFYSVQQADGSEIGQFYLDPYARQHKRGGAWMDVCRSRIPGQTAAPGQNSEDVPSEDVPAEDVPVAYLVCNASPPIGEQPALLTHDEVVTLFHEFGHGLHHMLTRIRWPSVGGINGVEWDAVELPSQFMENWAWERAALDSFAKHWQTGEPLPAELFEKMQAAKNFQSALGMLRQLEFALFDLRLHRDWQAGASAEAIQQQLDSTRAEVTVLKPPAFNRFQNGFGHIFAGGYAAGYYSYKWAEVLSADAFSAFEEAGVFHQESGQRFKAEVLEMGASRPAADSFLAFRGREPEIEPLLRHSGIDCGIAA